MNKLADAIRRTAWLGMVGLSALAQAQTFVSGSTGTDGLFSPTVNTVLTLPPSGIFNFTSVNIPTGVTVTFQKNVTNTPVVLLATGNVTVAGTIDVSGTASPDVASAGNGVLGNDGLPGVAGPGGFDGGRGGPAGSQPGGAGVGPGAGVPGSGFCTYYSAGGGGGGYGAVGASSQCRNWSGTAVYGGDGGLAYGSSIIQPLVGGSGGGGGASGSTFDGSGGGGGGGAILIAASGTISVTGAILANGGGSGASAAGATGAGATGGGGAGGAIRLVATTIAGNGTISAVGGSAGTSPNSYIGGAGAIGRVRLEAQTLTRTAATTPAYLSDLPGAVFLAGVPTLTIATIAGVAVPAAPTGNADVTLPATTVNPVTVVFQTSNVPVGNTIALTVTPASGTASTYVSPALTGTTASATSSVSATLPSGPSVLLAQTTYTIVASLGDVLSRFAMNERVERITLQASLAGDSTAFLETASGKRFTAPPEALQIAALGR